MLLKTNLENDFFAYDVYKEVKCFTKKIEKERERVKVSILSFKLLHKGDLGRARGVVILSFDTVKWRRINNTKDFKLENISRFFFLFVKLDYKNSSSRTF